MENATIFDLIEPLDPARRAALVKFCHDIKLSESAIEGVEQAARMLREFELYEKPTIPTAKEQIDNLKNIAELSEKLQRAIESTSGVGKVYLHGYMEKNTPPKISLPEIIPASGLAGYMIIALSSLESAALNSVDVFSTRLKQRGRKSVMGYYYAHIHWVWISVVVDGISLGRNGKFEKICNAVFQAAGVPASAEGAVRFYVENKHRANAAGELDDVE